MQMIHLASRLFGSPLLIERGKLDAILGALSQRLNIDVEQPVNAFGPGDTGKARKPYYVTEDKIGVIDAIGLLVKRISGDFLSGGPTTYAEIENDFMDAVTDPSIRGILMVVDSPGGECVGCFELADLIHSQRGTKPIVAVADGDAFSAAYALASSADELWVTKTGGVGSVGVWMLHVDQSKWNEKAGIKPTYIFAGAHKVDGNPHEPLGKDAMAALQGEVDRIHGMFVDTVARNRGMSAKVVRGTEARLFMGQDGVAVGFADEVGGLNDALASLRSRINGSGGKQRAAASAPSKTTKGAQSMNLEETEAPEVETPKEATPTESPAEEAQQQEAPANAAAIAADIVDLCVLAAMPDRAAAFIRAGASIDRVRQDLLAARAAEDANQQIHSHIHSETGTTAKTSIKDSPIVKAAEMLANVGKEK